MSDDVPPSEISVNQRIHNGEPIITGTATPVRAIAELWNQGMAAEEIPVHLPHLNLQQIFAALHYYLANRAEIDEHIRANHISEALHGQHFDPAKAVGK